jgi:hypothetical protein
MNAFILVGAPVLFIARMIRLLVLLAGYTPGRGNRFSAQKLWKRSSTASNKQIMPLKYPCSVCGSNADCFFVGSDPCPRR